MPTATLDAEEIVTGWLTDTPMDGWDSPAGPLYLGGEFAVQEITLTGNTGTNCSICTGSQPVQCC
jgi:hypothetical protein